MDNRVDDAGLERGREACAERSRTGEAAPARGHSHSYAGHVPQADHGGDFAILRP